MSTISKGHPGLTQKEITERYNAMIEREKRYNPSFGIINPEDQKEVEKHKRVTDNLMKRASKAECDVDLQTGQTYSSEWLQSVTTEKAPTRYTQSFSGVTAPIPSSGYTAPMSYPSNTKKGGRNRRSKQRRSNQRKLNKRNSLRN